MLEGIVYSKQLPFRAVLMDSWYATKDVMLHAEKLSKLYYCPLKTNRLVGDSGATRPYCRVDSLDWTGAERTQGKRVKLRGFPKDHKVQLFRVAVSTHRVDYVVTDDKAQLTTQAVQEVCALRWKKSPQQGVSCRYDTAGSMTRCYLLLKAPFEQLHREVKQLTGLEHCQCRKARIQRNHIACAFLVWIRLDELAQQTERTLYELKHSLLDDYLSQQLGNPSLRMTLA